MSSYKSHLMWKIVSSFWILSTSCRRNRQSERIYWLSKRIEVRKLFFFLAIQLTQRRTYRITSAKLNTCSIDIFKLYFEILICCTMSLLEFRPNGWHSAYFFRIYHIWASRGEGNEGKGVESVNGFTRNTRNPNISQHFAYHILTMKYQFRYIYKWDLTTLIGFSLERLSKTWKKLVYWVS